MLRSEKHGETFRLQDILVEDDFAPDDFPRIIASAKHIGPLANKKVSLGFQSVLIDQKATFHGDLLSGLSARPGVQDLNIADHVADTGERFLSEMRTRQDLFNALRQRPFVFVEPANPLPLDRILALGMLTKFNIAPDRHEIAEIIGQ